MRTDQRGAASVLVTVCLVVLLLVGAALGVVAAIVRAHRAAQSAADLAALAGAGALQRGDDPCGSATGLAVANGARLVACRVEGRDVVVRVRVSGPRWLGAVADPDATARAGPGDGSPEHLSPPMPGGHLTSLR